MSQTADYAFFDCDHHFYETRDSFTRHIDPAFPAVTEGVEDRGDVVCS